MTGDEYAAFEAGWDAALRERDEEVARLTFKDASGHSEKMSMHEWYAYWKGRAEQAERERDELKTQLDADDLYLYNGYQEVKRERDALRERVRRLEEAITLHIGRAICAALAPPEAP